MDSHIWQQLLSEADRDLDGVISENEFTQAMQSMIQKRVSQIQIPQKADGK